MRKDMKMSQREFGMKFGLDQQAVSKWENGKSLPSTNVLIQMSEAAGITIDQLLFDVCEEDKKMIDNDATAIINQYINLYLQYFKYSYLFLFDFFIKNITNLLITSFSFIAKIRLLNEKRYI